MPETKLSAGLIIDEIKKQTNGLNLANEVKDRILEYIDNIVDEEISKISNWAKEITELQGKRTIQAKDWDFILNKILLKK